MAKKGRRGGWARRTWEDEVREAFLEDLARTCNIAASCRAVGMSEGGFYSLRRRDAGFRAQFNETIGDSYALMELKYQERAIHGTRKPVFHAGKKVGFTLEYPDRVAVTLLRAHAERAALAQERDRFRHEELELARLRLAEKLSEMNRKMGGGG